MAVMITRVKATGHIEVKEMRQVVDEDGNTIQVPHRHVVSPGEDVSKEAPLVQARAAEKWTPELIAAEEARKTERERQP